jgi:hypothetical protein
MTWYVSHTLDVIKMDCKHCSSMNMLSDKEDIFYMVDEGQTEQEGVLGSLFLQQK